MSYLSIHDLTRRSTEFFSSAGRIYGFQFTTSQGGRRYWRTGAVFITIFQFMTSQGGRRLSAGHCGADQPFNSRPHKEVDRYPLHWVLRWNSFNSRPHKEVDCFPKCSGTASYSFNSRPHKEVDGFCVF